MVSLDIGTSSGGGNRDGAPELFRNGMADLREELVPVLIASPFARALVEVVVPGADSSRVPNLVCGGLAVEHVRGPSRKLDLDDAVGRLEVDFIRVEIIEPVFDLSNDGVSAL